jgi:uncharacterized membrane protein
VEVKHTVTIRRPIEDVFALVSDPDRDLEWGTLMVESVKLSPDPLGVGSVFQQRAAFMGLRPTLQICVTEFEPCTSMAYRVEQPVVAHHRRALAETLDGTELSFFISLEPPRQYQLGAAMMRRGVQHQVEADLSRIKRLMEETPETGDPVRPDEG